MCIRRAAELTVSLPLSPECWIIGACSPGGSPHVRISLSSKLSQESTVELRLASHSCEYS